MSFPLPSMNTWFAVEPSAVMNHTRMSGNGSVEKQIGPVACTPCACAGPATNPPRIRESATTTSLLRMFDLRSTHERWAERRDVVLAPATCQYEFLMERDSFFVRRGPHGRSDRGSHAIVSSVSQTSSTDRGLSSARHQTVLVLHRCVSREPQLEGATG